ncbi:hypothetical protein CRUP_024445, partial [Coryphaenoides rupestris]
MSRPSIASSSSSSSTTSRSSSAAGPPPPQQQQQQPRRGLLHRPHAAAASSSSSSPGLTLHLHPLKPAAAAAAKKELLKSKVQKPEGTAPQPGGQTHSRHQEHPGHTKQGSSPRLQSQPSRRKDPGRQQPPLLSPQRAPQPASCRAVRAGRRGTLGVRPKTITLGRKGRNPARRRPQG